MFDFDKGVAKSTVLLQKFLAHEAWNLQKVILLAKNYLICSLALFSF